MDDSINKMIVTPFKEGGLLPKWEMFLTIEEAYEAAGCPVAKNIEAQRYRIGIAQGALSTYAADHPNFVAIKENGVPCRYGWTKDKELIRLDNMRRRDRMLNGEDNYLNRAGVVTERYPDLTNDLTIQSPKHKLVRGKRKIAESKKQQIE